MSRITSSCIFADLGTIFKRVISKPYLSAETFSSLKELRVYNCPQIRKLFMPQWLTQVQNLEEIHIEDCVQMMEVIATSSDEEDEEEIYWQKEIVSYRKTLPKLRVLQLWNLSELESICGSWVLACDSLQNITVGYCKKLRSIPLVFTLVDGEPSPPHSLQIVKAYPKEWWDSPEWENPKSKSVLQPLCQFSRFLRMCESKPLLELLLLIFK